MSKGKKVMFCHFCEDFDRKNKDLGSKLVQIWGKIRVETTYLSKLAETLKNQTECSL